ncbi:MAG: dTDP-4-amino-4,6-dideoxygalactose transaminase [Selenomonas ruminantium]|nr:dTDP-4-amino-4,6-dideoxygalactose transaminase [Selenomonas ruminantium]
MIPFNNPVRVDKEKEYVQSVIESGIARGDAKFCKKCSAWIEEKTSTNRALLTSSCTHALELAAILSDIKPGDEVIMPSFTFCSTANAFALRGAEIVFVDIRPDTMNIDENKIEEAITEKTKAIVPVHYAGVSCEMDTIMDIAGRHNLLVVEDAAQGVMSTYKGKALGAIGDFGCYSFHETKNYSMGEGGALLVNRDELSGRAEIVREKGTNRAQFLRGQVDKYSWVDIGSSYLPSEFSAAYLYAQLEMAEEINSDRLKSWELYYNLLKPLADGELIELPYVPDECKHNAHMFYIKVKDIEERTKLIAYLKKNGVIALFHYVPLHSAVAGRKYGRFSREDVYTTRESNRLLRLPMWYGLGEEQIVNIVEFVRDFLLHSDK